MAKKSTAKETKVEPVAHANDVEPKVDEVPAGVGPVPTATEADKKTKFPEGLITGKFYAVKFETGFVVYNQYGQRATGIVTEPMAKDLVTKNNRDAGIKG